MIPTCFKFGNVLREYRLKGIKHLYKEDIDSSVTLDLYIRELNFLTDLDYVNYHKGENGILFESIVIRHVLQCDVAFSDGKTCYCERY